MPTNFVLYLILAAAGGLAAGIAAARGLGRVKEKELERSKKEILLEAKDEALKIKEEARADLRKKEAELRELEASVRKREASLSERASSLDEERKQLESREKELSNLKGELIALRDEQKALLEKISKMKKEEARKTLLDLLEKEEREAAAELIRKVEREAKEEADRRARQVLTDVIGRIASEYTAEVSTVTVPLPNEEMKGRIIGKEGRNIQAFEKECGVDVIIDETPGVVVLSSFDPVRREVARIAMEKLIADGRIQPARIEEFIAKAKDEVGKAIREAGEEAARDAKVAGLHPDIIKILGRLKYRTSYGQNVLRHSVEVAHISGLLAAELGASEKVARTAALLHDLGKALDQEVEGPHHHISMKIARKYGLEATTINAIGAHHEDIEPESIEAVIVRAADAISGARPGARRESLEAYVKRLAELEELAQSFPGVEKSYAIQAGREVRIFVKPEEIDDAAMTKLARDIAERIEKEIQYPGQIKVSMIRETRVVEYAR